MVVPLQHPVSYFVGNLTTSPVLRVELESPLTITTPTATHGNPLVMYTVVGGSDWSAYTSYILYHLVDKLSLFIE